MNRTRWKTLNAKQSVAARKCCLALTLAIVWGLPPNFAIALEVQVESHVATTTDGKSVASNATSSVTELPPESELIYLTVRSANPVPPQGWRRTEQGWEHVSTWHKPGRPLGELVHEQELREPRWLADLMSRVRQLPPLAYASLQFIAIAGVIRLSNRKRKEKAVDQELSDSTTKITNHTKRQERRV